MNEDDFLDKGIKLVENVANKTDEGKLDWSKVIGFNKINNSYESVISNGYIKEVYEAKWKKDIYIYVGSYVVEKIAEEGYAYDKEEAYISINMPSGIVLSYNDTQLNRHVEENNNDIYKLLKSIKVKIAQNDLGLDDLFS